MHSSTHHAGMPLNHLVVKGTDEYWTYKQNGIRRMKPFVQEYFDKAPKGKNYNVTGYLVNSDGRMVHVAKNNEVTFYEDMNAQQKKSADKFKTFKEKIKSKPKASKPAEGKEQTQPRVNPNDFYQKVYFPERFNFSGWDPAVKSYFIKRNKQNEQFYFQEIEQKIKDKMREDAVKWFESKRNRLLEMQRKNHGAHAQPQPPKKKPSAVSTVLTPDEITKIKEKVEKIEIIKTLHNSIEKLQKSNKTWPNTNQTKFNELLQNFFFQYEHKNLLFEDRDENLLIRDKLMKFKNIFENENEEFGQDDVLKAFSCYIYGRPHNFDEIKAMKPAEVSVMTKNLINSLQELKSELFKILLAHEKKRMQKGKEQKLQARAANSLGLDPNSTREQIQQAAEDKITNSVTSNVHLASPVLYYALYNYFNRIPFKTDDKFSFELSPMNILFLIIRNNLNLNLKFFNDCFMVHPKCIDCLNEIKRESRQFYSTSQENIYHHGDGLNPEPHDAQ